jgi:hypothetical protein
MRLKPRLFTKPIKGHWVTKILVGLWLLNEGSGNIIHDSSGHGHHGILTSATGNEKWSGGKFGGGWENPVENDNNYFNVTHTPAFQNLTGLTLLYWAKNAKNTKAAVHEYLMYSKGGGNDNISQYGMTSGEDFSTTLYDVDGANDYSGSFTDGMLNQAGIWHQLVVTWDGVSLKHYIDAVLGDTTAAAGSVCFTMAHDIRLAGEGATCWHGVLDHIMMLGEALSASQISLLLRDPFCMFERDPIELWVGSVGAGGGPAANAPTGALYGSLVGSLGGPI